MAKLACAVFAVLLVAVGVYSFSRKRQGGDQPKAAEPTSAPTVAVRPAQPDPREVAKAVSRLKEATPEELPDVVASVDDPDRGPAIASFLDAYLRRPNVPPEDFLPTLKACQKLAPDLLAERLADRLPYLVPTHPGQWEAGWGQLFAMLPEDKRETPGLLLGHRMVGSSTPASVWLEWLPLLATLEKNQEGESQLGITLPEQQALEELPSSLVLLRFQGEPCMGVVIGMDGGVNVLSQPVEVRRPESRQTSLAQRALAIRRQRSGASAEAPSPTPVEQTGWQASTGAPSGDGWVSATCSYDVLNATTENNASTTCFLLRFPATGELSQARPVRIVDADYDTLYDIRRAPKGEDASPRGWMVSASAVDTARNKVGQVAGSGACFSPNGGLVALHGGSRVLSFDKLTPLLQPRFVPQSTVIERGQAGGAAVVTFAVFDGRGVLRNATAMVQMILGDTACEQAEERFSHDPGEPAVTGGEEIALEIAAGRASLRIPVAEDQPGPFLVQVRCRLADDGVCYGVPLVVSTVGSRSVGTDDWLVTERRRQELAAASSGAPIPLHHTVNGRAMHYGSVTATELAVEPSDLIADATGESIYVGDRVGVRRIELDGFRETAGVLAQTDSVLLTGSSRGLVVVLNAGKEAELRLLDPRTLAERGRLKPPFTPTHIAGSWRSSLLVLVGSSRTLLFDLSASKVIQELQTSELLIVPPKTRASSRTGVEDVCMTPQGDMLCVLGRQFLRRFRLSATKGLAALQEGDVTPMETGGCGMLVMGCDGALLLSGYSVFSLRQNGLIATLGKPPHRPLAVAQGNRWMLATTTIDRNKGFFSVLDHRGVPIERWGAASALPGRRNRGLALPGGRRCLAWSSGGAILVEWNAVPDAGEAKP